MTKERVLIFRYDNAPHFRHLAEFPHHKHTSGAVVGVPEPELQDVLVEIEETMLRKKQRP